MNWENLLQLAKKTGFKLTNKIGKKLPWKLLWLPIIVCFYCTFYSGVILSTVFALLLKTVFI